jgi:ferredoxin
MKSMGRVISRLALAMGLFAGSFLIPARSYAYCAFECWQSTWFPTLGDCIAGPPDTCRSCIEVCPASV